MLYAVKRINDNPNLLPGLKLGVDIKDTCGSVNYAIMESLNFNFIRNKLTALEQKECNKNLRNVHERTTFAPSGDGKSFNTDSTSRLTSNSKGSTQQNLSGGKMYFYGLERLRLCLTFEVQSLKIYITSFAGCLRGPTDTKRLELTTCL